VQTQERPSIAYEEYHLPLTQLYHFVITFAGAASRDAGPIASIDRVYRILEVPQHGWLVSENEQPAAITGQQQARLAQLLAALERLPDPALEPLPAGSDGTWVTAVVQRGDQQVSYRWWVHPPAEWDALGAVTQFVQQLAEAPREQEADGQRQIARQFFSHLVARDLRGMLAHYHPDIRYSNPFFELHGAQVGALWRMCWSYLPDMRVVCADSGIRGSSVYWEAHYTDAPTLSRAGVWRDAVPPEYFFSARDGGIAAISSGTTRSWRRRAYERRSTIARAAPLHGAARG
jgi:hypothetical protein